jgi:F420-non-reducing hydrogenase iron-sulfur subunit
MKKIEGNWEPRLMIFSCKWCFPLGLEEERALPEGSSVLRSLCSGRIHPSFVFQAFESGADGVFIAACEEGDCHYGTGTEILGNTIDRVDPLLDMIGIESSRFRVRYFPPGKADMILESVQEFRDQLEATGPRGPLSSTPHLTEVK